jgi:hypothetical protein
MSENDRQQRMVERIVEDERLRGDLEDTAATALVNWASERVAKAAADPARPDDAVEAEVQVIRKAAQAAARSGESEPQRLLSLAEKALAGSAAPAAAAAQPPAGATPAPSAARDEPAPKEPAAAAPATGAASSGGQLAAAPASAAAASVATPSASAAEPATAAAAPSPPGPTIESPAATAQQPADQTERVQKQPAKRARSRGDNLSDGQSRRKRKRLGNFLKRPRGGR